MPTVKSKNYNLSLTAISLRPELGRIVAQIYLETGNWDIAKERVLASNALQANSAVSNARMERELRPRIQRLTHDQISLLAKSNAEDRAAISWLAVCKHIVFAFEFAAEVLREKLAAHDPVLRPSDYETYVETKSVIHPELARLTASSKSKIRRFLRYMLYEAGLLSAGAALATIYRPVLSTAIIQSITSDNPRWLAGFLVPNAEIGYP